jgi:hypothetical protein
VNFRVHAALLARHLLEPASLELADGPRDVVWQIAGYTPSLARDLQPRRPAEAGREQRPGSDPGPDCQSFLRWYAGERSLPTTAPGVRPSAEDSNLYLGRRDWQSKQPSNGLGGMVIEPSSGAWRVDRDAVW